MANHLKIAAPPPRRSAVETETAPVKLPATPT